MYSRTCRWSGLFVPQAFSISVGVITFIATRMTIEAPIQTDGNLQNQGILFDLGATLAWKHQLGREISPSRDRADFHPFVAVVNLDVHRGLAVGWQPIRLDDTGQFEWVAELHRDHRAQRFQERRHVIVHGVGSVDALEFLLPELLEAHVFSDLILLPPEALAGLPDAQRRFVAAVSAENIFGRDI